MSGLLPIIALCAGLIVGALALWLMLRTKAAGAASEVRAEFQSTVATLTERVNAKEQQIAQLQSALAAEGDQKAQLATQLQQESNASAAAGEKSRQLEEQLRAQGEQTKEAQTTLEAQRQQAAGARNDLASAAAQCDAERKARILLAQEHAETRAGLDRLQAELLEQRRQNGELTEKVRYMEEKLGTQRQEIEGIQQKFQKEFEAVANKLLMENSSRFGQQSAEGLDKLLGPLRDNLNDFKVKLDTVQQETATHTALLKDQISRIGTEAANLAKALKGDVKVLGNSAVGTGVLNASGVATLAIATLPVGSDSITASYPGDSRYLPGVSAPAIETVSPGTATAKLTSSASSASYGASVTLTATLTGAGAKPTGTINFLNGNTSLGTGTLNSSGVATLATTALPVGADSLKAAYSGDANYAAATSPALAVTIGKAAQTITFTAPATPVTYGAAPIALAATANSGLTVTFTTTGPATVNGSTLTITGAGSVTVSASQTGNSNYAAATAVSKTITVNKATPTDIVTPSSTTAPNGSSVTFTAAVTGPGSTAPTGTVTFMDGTTTLGTGKLTSGSAAYSTTKLTTGIHTVTAKYAGDTNYAAATSVGVTVTITAK